MVRMLTRGVVMALLLMVVSCASEPMDGGARNAAEREEVVAALQRYQAAFRGTDWDGIANSYSTDAMLLEPGIQPIQTRVKIREFLGSFPGVRVDAAEAQPESVEVFGETAIMWGSYFEKLGFPGQPVSEQHGRFVIEWIKGEKGAWLIKRMMRVPVATTEEPIKP